MVINSNLSVGQGRLHAGRNNAFQETTTRNRPREERRPLGWSQKKETSHTGGAVSLLGKMTHSAGLLRTRILVPASLGPGFIALVPAAPPAAHLYGTRESFAEEEIYSPLKPVGQMHWKVPNRLMQVAPFRHAPSRHSSTSWSQRSPRRPVGHRQV